MRICPATATAEMSKTRRGLVREPFAKAPEKVNLWCFAKTQTIQKHQRLTFVVSRVSFCVVCCQLISRGFRIYPWEVNPTGSGCIMAKPKGEMTTWPSERSSGPNESQRTSSAPHFIIGFRLVTSCQNTTLIASSSLWITYKKLVLHLSLFS
jgi:hypothetical protein